MKIPINIFLKEEKRKGKEKVCSSTKSQFTKKEGIFKSSAKQTDAFTVLNFTT